MNTKLNEANEAKNLAVSLSGETLETLQAVNNTLTVAEVSPVFQGHYANAQLDLAGLADLIKSILRDSQAEFSRNAHETELRKIVVACALFTSDIAEQVQARFTAGSTRYPLQSIKNVLSTYCKGEIAKIKLTNSEDQPRECCKPRCKWYLIATK